MVNLQDAKEGWIPFYMPYGFWGKDGSPYQWEEIEAYRLEWDKPQVLRPRELHPMFNVANLFWRPIQKVTSVPLPESPKRYKLELVVNRR